MKQYLIILLMLLCLPALLQAGELGINKPAPDFTLSGTDGKTYSLKDFRGKYVVLEWINYDCPFVEKHYKSGNMQQLQQKYQKKGVVWFSICSSASGKQGNYPLATLKKRIKAVKAAPSAYLIDGSGKTGQSYNAKVTPHMFIINPQGRLIYAGAIDNIRSADIDDIAKAENYVSSALEAAMAGNPIKIKASTPYGCRVKYK